MCDLREQRCKPCEGGIAPHSQAESKAMMKQLNAAWTLSSDGKLIRREFKFKNFYRTMSFVNAIAHIANTEDHHPDLEVGYGNCNITFTTHAIDGLSANDFICAAKIDALSI
ncbi:MAG: 4a-hydroxytetrahydrobiopterin dehydratase [Candidatus Obscuribacterales bacterium]|nr:4a-hydroxytetrahydrobiopterin dehydratase [Steroidobacteraceae bacterium]